MSTSTHTTTGAVILAGLIAGTVDIGAACLISWLGPAVILRAIASGLLGTRHLDGGIATALLGLVLQWAMAIVIAIIYLAATRSQPLLRRRWGISGVIAGVVIFLVMNYVVVPLSAAPFRPSLTIQGLLTVFTPYQFIANLLAMIVFGLIISYCLRDVSAPAAPKIERA